MKLSTKEQQEPKENANIGSTCKQNDKIYLKVRDHEIIKVLWITTAIWNIALVTKVIQLFIIDLAIIILLSKKKLAEEKEVEITEKKRGKFTRKYVVQITIYW